MPQKLLVHPDSTYILFSPLSTLLWIPSNLPLKLLCITSPVTSTLLKQQSPHDLFNSIWRSGLLPP